MGNDHRESGELSVDKNNNAFELACLAHISQIKSVLGSDELERMVRRREAFRDETGTSKALHLVLVCASGVAASKHLSSVQAVVTGDDLFARAVS